MSVNWNAGKISTNNKVNFGSNECWINKEGIYNIFSIPKFEEMGFHITYDSRDGHYIVYTKDGEIQFNNYEMVLTSTVSNYITGQQIFRERNLHYGEPEGKSALKNTLYQDIPGQLLQVQPYVQWRDYRRHNRRKHLDIWTLKFSNQFHQQEGMFWFYLVLYQ